MTNPQSGVLSADGPARYFLEYRLRPGVDAGALRAALGAALIANEEVETVVAFGPSAVKLLELGVDCEAFATIQGAGHSAPSTQRDLWVWVHGAGHDAVFDRVMQVHRAIAPVTEVELELRGFDYRNSHDLIGVCGRDA